ncbi:unnamed protein product [Penicillium salamii]|nr:unnamed protein product [Penicillium salamii]
MCQDANYHESPLAGDVQPQLKSTPIATSSSALLVNLPTISRNKEHDVFWVANDVGAYLERDLDHSRLNKIHGHLWMAGRPLNARPIHRQKMMGFDIILTEQADLHLLKFSNKIFIKPLPDYMLNFLFWEMYLCKSEDLHKSACGILLSYVWLICSPLDLKLAHKLDLLPSEITWLQWKSFVAEFILHVDPNTLDKVNKRYHFGELRLGRINSIYRIRFFFTHFIRGYLYGYNRYVVFFQRNFAWIFIVLVYFSLVLTAMQVGATIPPLNTNTAFLRASYGFSVFSIITVAAIVYIRLLYLLCGGLQIISELTKWIPVLDNVDDDELLRKPLGTRIEAQADAQYVTSTRPPLKYLLESSNGYIIITSRNQAVALEITGHKQNLIDVQLMKMAEAYVLMQKKLIERVEKEELVQLVEELDFMPLAIVQAASYINHRSPRCSASQYLQKLRQNERQATKLLDQESYEAGRDWEAKNSILLTWQISFDHIRRIRQSAADLMSLMSFFDWQGISKDLLRVKDIDRSFQRSVNDNFESDITTLRDYSLIATGEDTMIFTMHRLVQLTVRTWLKSQGQKEEWKERFITTLNHKFPTGEYENCERCCSLFPHVRGAWYAQECGNISESREMAALSRMQRMQLGGAEDKDTLDSTAMLAITYRQEGQLGEAEQLFVQVMETTKAKLGADHPDTLTSMANLASTLWNQG